MESAMEVVSLTTMGEHQIQEAQKAHSGRAGHTLYGGSSHSLRQTLIALAAGQRLDDHESPGEATLLVVVGHVELATATQKVTAKTGEYVIIPQEVHSLAANEDSAVLLTVATHRG